jgi:acyl dehydratase
VRLALDVAAILVRLGQRVVDVVAHGLLVLSCAAGQVPFDPDRVVALRKVGDAVFKQPVKIGDTVEINLGTVRTFSASRS